MAMHKAGQELELKLAVPEHAIAAIAAHPALHRSLLRPQRQNRQLTTYFDTRDQALAGRGISLRIRDAEGSHVQTVKAGLRPGLAMDRDEWEWSLDQPQPDAGLLSCTGLWQDMPDLRDFHPVVTTVIDRTEYDLAFDGGIITAALDRGEIVAGARRETISELELELRDGDPGAVFRLALELHAAIPMIPLLASKSERGYRLLNGTSWPACKAGPVALDASIDTASAFRRIIHGCLHHLLANRLATLAGDAEGLHQMRVAIRRLRSALALFQPLLEPHALAQLTAALRRVGRVFGEARDWDVFCDQILPGTLPGATVAGWRDLLAAPGQHHRQTAYRDVWQELASPDFTSLVLALGAWAMQPNVIHASQWRRPLRRTAPELLDRMAAKVSRRARHLSKAGNTERHALRKSLKKLRYGIDFAKCAFSRRQVKSYQQRCKKLQKRLGDSNDTVAATALADGLVAGGRPDLAPALSVLAGALDRRQRKAVRGIGKSWRRLRDARPFWR